MRLGLGSGSTVSFFVDELGRRLRDGRVRAIVGVPTSRETERLARDRGVPLTTLEAHPALDLTVDGADEVDPELNLIKGHGGALLREKIVALASERMIAIVDASKLVRGLGEHTPLPVEVVQFGWSAVAARVEALGGKPSRRKAGDGRPFVTDEGHYILDCAFGILRDPRGLAEKLRSIVGVVEHGLFLGIAYEVIVAAPEGIRVLRRGSPLTPPFPPSGARGT